MNYVPRGKPVRMTQALSASQCDVVRDFFALLLKIKHLDSNNKGVNVGKAFDVWNYEQFGLDKKSITARRKASRLMN
jgi:hypothetical protein